jgi:hypothetical protein
VLSRLVELVVTVLGFILVTWFLFTFFVPGMAHAIGQMGKVHTPAPVVSASPR